MSAMVLHNRYLRENGAPAGATNMNVNGSITPVQFRSPVEDYYQYFNLCMWYLEDAGALDAGFLGNNITLTNGILFEVQLDGVLYDVLDGLPIFNNGHWKRLAFDATDFSVGQGNNIMSARFSFNKSLIGLDERPKPLILAPGDFVQVTIQDNLTGLEEFDVFLEGTRRR